MIGCSMSHSISVPETNGIGFFHDDTWPEYVTHLKLHGYNWTFSAECGALIIRIVIEDSKHPGELMSSSHNFKLPESVMTVDEKDYFVLDCVMKVHTHESRELLKRDGMILFFPKHGTEDIYRMPLRD